MRAPRDLTPPLIRYRWLFLTLVVGLFAVAQPARAGQLYDTLTRDISSSDNASIPASATGISVPRTAGDDQSDSDDDTLSLDGSHAQPCIAPPAPHTADLVRIGSFHTDVILAERSQVASRPPTRAPPARD